MKRNDIMDQDCPYSHDSQSNYVLLTQLQMTANVIPVTKNVSGTLLTIKTDIKKYF